MCEGELGVNLARCKAMVGDIEEACLVSQGSAIYQDKSVLS